MVLFLQVLLEYLTCNSGHATHAFHGMVYVGMMAYWYTNWYEIFTTIILVLACMVTLLLNRRMSTQSRRHPLQQNVYKLAIVYIVSGKVAWLLEQHYSEWLLPINLHPVWHTLSALACYYAILTCMLFHICCL